MKGKLIVVSGPSGSGKSTATRLVRDRLQIPLSISATTRLPRTGEIDGKDYFFLEKEDFENRITNGEFYEYALVHGNYYGTLREEVESRINSGQNVILEIDVQGGLIVKEKNSEAILVFFKAPSMEILAKRLGDRKTDSKEVIKSINKIRWNKGRQTMKKEKITIDELLTKIPNKYELAIVAGSAAREEFIDGVEKYKIMDNVFEEIMNDEILLHNK